MPVQGEGLARLLEPPDWERLLLGPGAGYWSCLPCVQSLQKSPLVKHWLVVELDAVSGTMDSVYRSHPIADSLGSAPTAELNGPLLEGSLGGSS